jgi:hypothetical protein
MAMPALIRAKIAANETSAIGSLRTVNAGQAVFKSACGNGGFASTLEDLARVPPGASQAFIPPDLSVNAGPKSGYLLALNASSRASQVSVHTCNGASGGSVSAYFAEAHPADAGQGTPVSEDDTDLVVLQ